MKEQYINYTTAVLAKLKEFDEPTVYSYSEHDKEIKPNIVNNSIGIRSNSEHEYYNAPTKYQLQEWLRKKHAIDVVIYPSFMGKVANYYYLVFLNRDFDNIIQGETKGYSYEEAFENGLVEGLIHL